MRAVSLVQFGVVRETLVGWPFAFPWKDWHRGMDCASKCAVPLSAADSPASGHLEAAGEGKGLTTCAWDTMPTACMHASLGPCLLLI